LHYTLDYPAADKQTLQNTVLVPDSYSPRKQQDDAQTA
jgi:hypothetical protein